MVFLSSNLTNDTPVDHCLNTVLFGLILEVILVLMNECDSAIDVRSIQSDGIRSEYSSSSTRTRSSESRTLSNLCDSYDRHPTVLQGMI